MVTGNSVKVTRSAVSMGLLLFFMCAAFLSVPFTGSAESADFFLYMPTSVDQDEVRSHEQGVLVRKIMIRRGDTLTRLSRYYNRKGHYYPQILLFNNIADPDRIYAGRELLVPVSHRRTAVKTEKNDSFRNSMQLRKRRRYVSSDTQRAVSSDVTALEKQHYERAVAQFDSGKYREAIGGFTRFLEEYPYSPFAAEARLYRADSYLRLSEQ